MGLGFRARWMVTRVLVSAPGVPQHQHAHRAAQGGHLHAAFRGLRFVGLLGFIGFFKGF